MFLSWLAKYRLKQSLCFLSRLLIIINTVVYALKSFLSRFPWWYFCCWSMAPIPTSLPTRHPILSTALHPTLTSTATHYTRISKWTPSSFHLSFSPTSEVPWPHPSFHLHLPRHRHPLHRSFRLPGMWRLWACSYPLASKSTMVSLASRYRNLKRRWTMLWSYGISTPPPICIWQVTVTY